MPKSLRFVLQDNGVCRHNNLARLHYSKLSVVEGYMYGQNDRNIGDLPLPVEEIQQAGSNARGVVRSVHVPEHLLNTGPVI